jgi:hypothetical protein
MNPIVFAMKVYVPKWMKRKNLNSLFEATANAFGVIKPPIDHLSYEQLLEKYAVFTSSEAERILQSGDKVQEIKDALYRQAYDLGNKFRKQLHLGKKKDALAVVKVLYNAIGIDFRASDDGSIKIYSCYFSRFYSTATCLVMSSMDEGIVAGLSGGGKLSFSERITEGKRCCVAFLNINGDAV